MRPHLSAFAALALFTASAAHAQPAASTIGYPTVAAALADLKARGVPQTKAGDWILFTDRTNRTQWAFAPQSIAAYPAVVKRQVVAEDGQPVLRMSVACEADEAACQGLANQFQLMTTELAGRVNTAPTAPAAKRK